jgi:surface protein
MKTLKESILSSTKTGMATFLVPETKEELMKMIKKEIREKGYKCDLNHIKTHKITDMSTLFFKIRYFNGDISKWNVSNVENMSSMFWDSSFNGDISKWNVSKVKDMSSMFGHSSFNGDISNWNVSNVENMRSMFQDSKKFNSDISNWNVSNIENMSNMFWKSKFNQDVSNWKINPNCATIDMFYGCIIKDEYKPKQNGKTIE